MIKNFYLCDFSDTGSAIPGTHPSSLLSRKNHDDHRRHGRGRSL